MSSSDEEDNNLSAEKKAQSEKMIDKFFTQNKQPQNKRMGLQAEKLSAETLKQQQKNKMDKVNGELKFMLLKKHDIRKRLKRKGQIISYGEEDDEEPEKQEVPKPAEPAPEQKQTENTTTEEDNKKKRKQSVESDEDDKESKLKVLQRKKKKKKKNNK